MTAEPAVFAVIDVAHPALRGVRPVCTDCMECAHSAAVHARAMGSTGATFVVHGMDEKGNDVEHSARVVRALATVQPVSRHYARNVAVVKDWPDGAVKVRFDCSPACGMTGDETVGRDLATARQNAQAICRRHGSTIEQRVAATLRGPR